MLSTEVSRFYSFYSRLDWYCGNADRYTLLVISGVLFFVDFETAYWLDYGTSFYETDFQWRFPLAFQGVFASLLGLLVIGLPESPRWLVLKDRAAEAKSVLAALHDLPEDHPDVQLSLLEIQTAQELASRGGPFHYSELISGGKLQNWRRTTLTVVIMIMQQFTGESALVRSYHWRKYLDMLLVVT